MTGSIRILLFLFLAAVSLGADAQADPTLALRRVYEKANFLTAVSKTNWRAGLNMAAAILPTGGVIALTTPMEAGTTYTVLGTTETEEAVVDLQLFSPDGELMAADSSDDATPVVTYDCSRAGPYTVRLFLRSADSDTLGVAVTILESVGTLLPARAFRQLTSTFFASSAAITTEATKLTWATGNNRWCIYGLSPPPATPVDIGGLSLAATNNYFALAGLPIAGDVSLLLSDTTGRIVGTSGVPSPFPVLRYVGEQTQAYLLRIKTEGRSPTGQLLLGIFE